MYRGEHMATGWWASDTRERYWMEITNRTDLGADLKAPQRNENGDPYWSYSLINAVRPGDVVLHYSTPERAIVGYSTAVGPVEERDIIWGARGSSARSSAIAPHSRAGWLLPLRDYHSLPSPVALGGLTSQRTDIQGVRDWLAAKYGGDNLYFPFVPYRKHELRALQGYLAKFPRHLLTVAPTLAEALGENVGDLTRELGLSQTPLASDTADPDEASRPGRSEVTTYRILRDTALARGLKRLHNHECQICGTTIELPSGARYAEAHHIQPLGRPHNGPDVMGNILVLCPNHHAMCDYGTLRLTRELLRTHSQHGLGEQFLAYHNEHIASAVVAAVA
jgi:hypothetical protein